MTKKNYLNNLAHLNLARRMAHKSSLSSPKSKSKFRLQLLILLVMLIILPYLVAAMTTHLFTGEATILGIDKTQQVAGETLYYNAEIIKGGSGKGAFACKVNQHGDLMDYIDAGKIEPGKKVCLRLSSIAGGGYPSIEAGQKYDIRWYDEYHLSEIKEDSKLFWDSDSERVFELNSLPLFVMTIDGPGPLLFFGPFILLFYISYSFISKRLGKYETVAWSLLLSWFGFIALVIGFIV